MKKHLFSLFCLLLAGAAFSQEKYFTRSASIAFDAEGTLDDMENIAAKNNSGTCVVETSTGQMEWAVLIKGFLFENALAQEHFNENYMESSKYPKALFKGKITNPN